MAFPADAQPLIDDRNLRLDSWKEIAAYLNRGERTVRRWEKAEGLPVRRHVHEKAASVYAYSLELDAWGQARQENAQTTGKAAPRRPCSAFAWLKNFGTVLGVLVAGGAVTALLLPRSVRDMEIIAVPLTTYAGDELDPSFSPDASQVAFSWNGPSQNNLDIYVKTVGQENYARITRDPEEDFNPVWSPDGRFIAFLRNVGEEQTSVMLVSPVGGTEIMLAKFPCPRIPGFRTSFPARLLCWHSSSKYLLAAASDFGPFALRLISLTGEVRTLTAPDVTAELGDLNPTFAPDGKTIAFTRYFASGFGGQIYTLALSPEGETVAKPKPVSWAGSNVISAVWTHDGAEIIYQRYGEHTLWRTTAFERSKPRRVIIDAAEIRNPATSRTSRLLVFSSGRIDLDIARSETSQLDGELPIERVISSTRLDTEGRLSPDGRQIVFASERSGGHEIWIAEADGSAARQVTDPSDAINEHPSWSPDGRRIAFGSRLYGENGRIYIAQADRPGSRVVTNGSADDSAPVWSRDEKWLYFTSNRTGRSEIWKASTSNFADQQQVTMRGGDGAVESPDGSKLYYIDRTALTGPQHLWSIETATGKEQRLLLSRNIRSCDFVPADDGVYFANSPRTNSGSVLQFYELRTGQIRRVASLAKYYCCLDISKDRRHVYYSVLDSLGHDLMMVKNFD
jgi:Tol biopolymer transport system component